MTKSIYPSIPAPGLTPESMRTTLDAMRQAVTLVIMNAQKPHANFTPSSAAQVFVTHAQLEQLGLVPKSSGGTSASPYVAEAAAPISVVDRIAALEARIRALEDR